MEPERYGGPDVEPPWEAGARRTRALARDEHRLRRALEHQQARRFDLDAEQVLRDRTEDLLETISLIVTDEDLWQRLSDAAGRPLGEAQLERILELDGAPLAALLEVAGYRQPPPPPVDELVDETLDALAAALEEPARVGPAQVRRAQQSLITLVLRVRRQVLPAAPAPLDPSALRTSARRLGQAARWLLPRVAAVSAGALVEAHTPGTGVGLLVGKSVQKIVEDGLELAAAAIAARLPDGGDDPAEAAPVDALRGDPVQVHAAALQDQIGALRRAAENDGQDPEPAEIELARRAHRHLRRFQEVLEDAGPLDPDQRDALPAIGDALDRYLAAVPARTSARLLGTTLHMVDWLAETRAQDISSI